MKSPNGRVASVEALTLRMHIAFASAFTSVINASAHESGLTAPSAALTETRYAICQKMPKCGDSIIAKGVKTLPFARL